MQFVHFDDFKLGVLNDGRVVDVGKAVGEAGGTPQNRLETVIRNWRELAPELQAAAASGGVPVEQVRLRPSVPKPGQLVCAAVNYLEKARPEPQPFNAFLKSPNSIIGNADTVELPDTPATVFHFEPELALVIGKRAAHLTPDEAMAHVFGYTPFIDCSARGLPGGFFLGKSWHTFAPMGPALVTADEVANPNDLRIELEVNGQRRQDFSTGEMARHVPELLAEITKVIALEPGDVVATGVHHEGLSAIKGGDRVRMTIHGVGPSLEVLVHDAQERTWE